MIILMGMAGAGKSVQGKMLADKFGLPWLSTGEFLRMLVSGEKRKEMLQGKLLSDDEIIALVQKIFAVVGVEQEFVLDGFPRTAAQTDWLLSQIKHKQLNLSGIVYLTIRPEEAEERLLSRGRPDDKAESIQQRTKEFNEDTLPIINAFKEANVVIHEVDASGSVEEIHEKVVNIIKPTLKKLDPRKIPATTDSPDVPKTPFSAAVVSSDTLPADKRTIIESPLDHSGSGEVLRNSSKSS